MGVGNRTLLCALSVGGGMHSGIAESKRGCRLESYNLRFDLKMTRERQNINVLLKKEMRPTINDTHSYSER
jgi:hypothetical protein